MQNMNYTKSEWLNAKNNMVKALEQAAAALKVASDSITAACGQQIGRENVTTMVEVHFDHVHVTSWQCGEKWLTVSHFLAHATQEHPRVDVPMVLCHWNIKLQELKRSVAQLQLLGSPEAWELAWSKDQAR
jgi:hypothetical protein